MAHLRGIVAGERGYEASRLGSKASGIVVEAQSWEGKIVTHVWHDPALGVDVVQITMDQHHNVGESPPILLYRGPIGRYLPDEESQKTAALGLSYSAHPRLSLAHTVHSDGLYSPEDR